MPIHSVPAAGEPFGCFTIARAAPPALRDRVLGYGGFRSATGRGIRHRLLAISTTTLIVDFAGPEGLAGGSRSHAAVDGSRWGHGVSIGLTPAGVEALLGAPASELTGRIVPLTGLLGPRAAELGDRLMAAPGWAARFTLLDALLGRWMADAEPADSVMTGWLRLQQTGGRMRVGDLAGELGTPRRWLERAFRQRLGQSPGEVARIARFQRALSRIDRGDSLARVAAEGGYADQPHLTRETRALAGATPAELRAIVQDRPGRPRLASRA